MVSCLYLDEETQKYRVNVPLEQQHGTVQSPVLTAISNAAHQKRV